MSSNNKEKRLTAIIYVLSLALILATTLIIGPIICRNLRKFKNDSLNSARGQKSVFNRKIPIVVAFDNNYICPALVSLSSLFSNAKEDTYYKIFFLVTDEFTQENKNKIFKLGKDYKNFEAVFLNLNKESKQFKDLNIFLERFSKEMFYRLKIPSLLENEEKCIYMDVDTVVCDDLSDLYNEDLDGYCVGGIADGTRQAIKEDSSENIEKYHKYLGVNNMDDFINSGVIVWNLVECRNYKLEDRFLDFLKKRNNTPEKTLNDQDTINSGCHGKIKDLPLKYNVQTYYNLKSYEESGIVSKLFTEKTWQEAVNHPVIIHYALNKAWNCLDLTFADKWWKAAKTAPRWVWTEVREYKKTLNA
ncbi:MAG: glycosyltransferase family 8 protein [Oscillospiraceae bacterium]|jgi:lipopolysaccharide biosynthesis glycosyltransferase|nr:glycosyltransferase family 8 protein [Oscillospiraceae bacterium]